MSSTELSTELSTETPIKKKYWSQSKKQKLNVGDIFFYISFSHNNHEQYYRDNIRITNNLKSWIKKNKVENYLEAPLSQFKKSNLFFKNSVLSLLCKDLLMYNNMIKAANKHWKSGNNGNFFIKVSPYGFNVLKKIIDGDCYLFIENSPTDNFCLAQLLPSNKEAKILNPNTATKDAAGIFFVLEK